MSGTSRRIVLLTVLTGLGAALLNAVAVPWMAELSPGRILSLPVAILFGPYFGVLAGLLAALPYVVTFPSRLVLFGLEALVIGASSRRRWSLIAIGLVYWLGVALLFLARPEWVPLNTSAGASPLAYAGERTLNRIVAVVFGYGFVGSA